MSRCTECRQEYQDDEDSEGFETGLCPDCFECALEEYEVRRRRRIAEQNEY